MPDVRSIQDVNLSALDSMVGSYMLYEGLTEVKMDWFERSEQVSMQESGALELGREVKRKCLAVKDFILNGEIEKAKDLIQETCPEILEVRCFVLLGRKRKRF